MSGGQAGNVSGKTTESSVQTPSTLNIDGPEEVADKSGSVPGVEEDALKPVWFANKIVDHPCGVCCGIFIFVMFLGALDAITFGLSDGHERTWFVEDSQEAQDYDAWTLAEEALSNSGGEDVYADPQTQEQTGWSVFLLFELRDYDRAIDENDPSATDYWILTPENVELIIEYERLITNDSEWIEKYCYVEDTTTYECVYTSLARDIGENFGYNFDNVTTEDIKEYVFNFYYTTDSPGTVESSFNELFAETNQTYLYRSFLSAGAPITTSVEDVNGTTMKLSKYRNDNHNLDDQQADYDDFIDPFWQDITVDEQADLKDGNLRIVLFEGTVYNAEFNVLLLESMVWVIAAIFAVLCWMSFHLQSVFLSLTAVGEILLSFPFAFAIYRYILQIDHFDTLSMLIIFVLLGVGADDVFVFTDAWRQSLHFVRHQKNLKERMSFAYRRAAKAMLVTQATTFFAFMATSASRITPIAGFGLWASCIVLCNYILVITMYPALLLIHHRWVRPFERRFCCCCCEDAEEDEDEKQNKKAEKQRSLDRKASINEEENIELATTKKTQSISPRKGSTDDAISNFGSGDLADDGQVPPVLSRRQSSVEELAVEYDCLERFFAVKWARWINMLKIPVLIFFAVLFAMAVWRASQIEEQDEEEQWFPNGHYMKEVLDILDKYTSSESSGLVYVVLLWGTNGINRDGTDRWDPEDYGKIKWDNNFDVSSAEAQLYMYQQCHNLSESDLVFQATSVTCVFDYFEQYLESMDEEFPWVYNAMDENDTVTFDADVQKELFAAKLYNFTQSDYATVINYDSLLFVESPVDRDDGLYYVRYLAIGAYGDLDFASDLNVALDAQDDWEEWIKDNFNNNENAPDGLDNAIQASDRWCWLKTNREFILSAIQGIAIALPLAFLVLLISTQNWIMAIFATFDIIGVMACELAVMELMGWKFGVSESVAIVIVIGFSVDYVVHLANAFLESSGGIRGERTSFALLTMGISVVSGAITTFLAGIFLSFPEIIFFYKMGILIMTTIAFSLAWSMLFFIALLSFAGPQFKTGNIPCGKIYRKICKRGEYVD